MIPKSNAIHVAYVAHTYEVFDTHQDLLNAHFTTLEWARALTDVGAQVSVFYRFHSDGILTKGGVRFYFIKDSLPPSLKAYHFGFRFHKKVSKLIRDLNINIIHAHNTRALFPNWTLRYLANNTPIVIQDHSGKLVLKRTWFLKQMFSKVDGVIFAAKGQEKPWVLNNILPVEKCYFVMENSSPFHHQNRTEARKTTNMTGAPIYLWVGNLNENKDPFTALTAFASLIKGFPKAHFYMIYRHEDLEADVIHFIEENNLIQNVTLFGSKKRQELEPYFNSADFIVSSSYKEGSGYSVIEAMSCGVIPILTKIPSFSALTNDGHIGALYHAGDVGMLYTKMKELAGKSIPLESRRVLDHFHQKFSFSALAQNTIKTYKTILSDYE